MTSTDIELAKEFISNMGYNITKNSVFYGNVLDWKNEMVSFDNNCIYLYKVIRNEKYWPHFSNIPDKIYFLDEFKEKFVNTIKYYKNCLSIYRLQQLNTDFT